MPTPATLALPLEQAVNDLGTREFLVGLGITTVGQLVNALSVDALTTGLTLPDYWRRSLCCQTVGDLLRCTRRDFGPHSTHLWEQTNNILRAFGLPELPDDPVTAQQAVLHTQRAAEAARTVRY